MKSLIFILLFMFSSHSMGQNSFYIGVPTWSDTFIVKGSNTTTDGTSVQFGFMFGYQRSLAPKSKLHFELGAGYLQTNAGASTSYFQSGIPTNALLLGLGHRFHESKSYHFNATLLSVYRITLFEDPTGYNVKDKEKILLFPSIQLIINLNKRIKLKQSIGPSLDGSGAFWMTSIAI